jgi:hypothetical protein
MLEAGLLTLSQLAMVRTGILVGIGLCSWVLSAILIGVGVGWFHLPLASWYTAGIAFLLTGWLLGRIMGPIDLVASLHLLFFLLTSLLADFLLKEGLLLNLCFFLIPVVLPDVLLYWYETSFGWGFLLVPIGFVIGKLVYPVLEPRTTVAIN